MSGACGDDDRTIRRRGVVVGTAPGALDVRWTESQCRGCVGCGGRCGLFAGNDAGLASLEFDSGVFRAGDAIDVEIAAPRLRRAASLAYGLAILALIAGATFGHAIGARMAAPNVGAFVGLLVGTFLAGALTKRADVSPPLRVRPVTHLPSEPAIDSQEPPR